MLTTQIPIYNSIFWDPLTPGVDALAQADWQEKNNYLNAPFALIPRILDLLQEQKADATIIVPYWPGQIYNDTTLCEKFVSDLRQVRGFSSVSSTNKTDRHDITEIFMKLAN